MSTTKKIKKKIKSKTLKKSRFGTSMQEHSLLGIPFKYDSPPIESRMNEIESQKSELEDIGVTVKGVDVSPESTIFFIGFPYGTTSFSFRRKLRLKGYSIDQKMDGKTLRTCVTRQDE